LRLRYYRNGPLWCAHLTCRQKSLVGRKPPVLKDGCLVPYLHLARCDSAGLCALLHDQSRHLHFGEGPRQARRRPGRRRTETLCTLGLPEGGPASLAAVTGSAWYG